MIGQLLTGRYLLLEKLGVGGFSETFLACDKYLPHHPLCVVKYLKLPTGNTLSLEHAQQLFEAEACALEQLGRNHAQIPTLFAYCHEQDQAYLVQEYVDGENLSDWLARGKRLTTNSAIALLTDLLPVLNYVHSHRIIHRDITPSNLIRRQKDGKLVLIDFGAACILPETEDTSQPDTAATPVAIGTPGYMPDEQHLGTAELNSDLYALGVLTIHLLTGVHPKEFKQDLVSGELDWHRYLPDTAMIEPKLIEVLDRMVRSNSRDRYQQATEVLTDLETLFAASYLQPTAANWRKTAQKVVLFSSAALLAGGIGAWYIPGLARQAKPTLNQLTRQFQQQDVNLVMLHHMPVRSGVDRMVIAPDNRLLVTAGTDHTLRLWALPTGDLVKTFSGHRATVTTLAMSRDGKLLVSGSQDGALHLWDGHTGRLLRSLEGHQNPVTTVAISPDAQTVVTGCKGGVLRQWDVQTGVRMQTLKLPNAEITAALYGTQLNGTQLDGTPPDRLISAGTIRTNTGISHQLQIWDLRTGQLRRTFAGHTDAIVGLHLANPQTLLSFGKDRGMIWNLEREELVRVLPDDSANPVTISSHGQDVVTVHDNGKLRVWAYQAGRLVKREEGKLANNPAENRLDIALSPDHRYLVSWSSDQQLRVWQIKPKGV